MKFFYLFLALLAQSTLANAVLIVVQDGEVRTTQIIMPNVGDETLIKKGGVLTINILNAPAINMLNDNQFLDNSGTISTNSGSSSAVRSQGFNSLIINNGLITTSNANSFGIEIAQGDGTVITNTGTIFTAGTSSNAIDNQFADNLSITNSGSIITTNVGSKGIFQSESNSIIRNSGLISTSGVDAEAIFMDGDNNHIINSGTIKSSQSFAIQIGGLGNALSLLRGSNLQGPVAFFDNPLTLNVERGLNLALTFVNVSPGLITAGIDAPFVIAGNTIGVIDPTGLAMQADVVADLSDTILNGIYRHRFCSCSSCCRGAFWIQGLGSYRNRSHSNAYVGYDNWQGGFLLGYDRCASNGYFDIFAGIVYNEAQVDQRTQKACINSYVCGLTYESSFCDTYLGIAVALGYLDWDNKRFVMNNLANDGVETAHAGFGSFFLSPEVTLSRRVPFLFCHPLLSFNLRYAGDFIGDYHEKGSLTNLSVINRELDLVTARFELALPYGRSYTRCCWSIEPYLGAYGRYQVGGHRINGELLGQPIKFKQEGPRNLGAFLLGLRGTRTLGCWNLFVNFEASFDSADSSRVLGECGISWGF